MSANDYCPECGGIQPVPGVTITSESLHFHSDLSCSFRWNETLSKWCPDESIYDDFLDWPFAEEEDRREHRESMGSEAIEDHVCTDFVWFNPDIHSNDDMDEVLACTKCGKIKWTAREITAKSETTI